MAYGDDIDALNCGHRWSFDNTYNDQVGSANGTGSSTAFAAVPLCEDVTYSVLSDDVADSISIPSTTDINNSAQTRKAVAGWVRFNSIQLPPKNIYGEGNTSQAFRFIIGWGNNLLFECDDPNFTVQVFSDRFLAPDRTYHLCMIFEGNGYGNEVRTYLDGVEMTDALPSDRQPDYATLTARTQGEFSDPAGTVAVGGVEVILNGMTNGYLNQWATWDGADAVLTDTEVREELFEKGALPDITISTDTEANMQTAIDVYADTERSDAPLCIRVEPVSGGGNFELSLDNITFDSLASIHVQYTGTDTLTLVNTNGSDCSIVSTPNGGTITLVEDVSISINVKDIVDFSNLVNARVYLEADSGGPLSQGTEIMKELTNGSGIASSQFSYTSNQPFIGRVGLASSSPYYKPTEIAGVITSTGVSQVVFMTPDQ